MSGLQKVKSKIFEIFLFFQPLRKFFRPQLDSCRSTSSFFLPWFSSKINPNIVDGKYKNVMHYLDTHFRLLREDCIHPLREGIKAYTGIHRWYLSIYNQQQVRQAERKMFLATFAYITMLLCVACSAQEAASCIGCHSSWTAKSPGNTANDWCMVPCCACHVTTSKLCSGLQWPAEMWISWRITGELFLDVTQMFQTNRHPFSIWLWKQICTGFY